jgi:hypothetical protein
MFASCQNLFKDNLKKFKLTVDVEAPVQVINTTVSNTTASNTTVTNTTAISEPKKVECPSEKLSPSASNPYVIRFNSTDDKAQVITLNEIKAFFKKNVTCPITAAFLFADTSEKSLGIAASQIVTIDLKTFSINIQNSVNASSTMDFVIKAKTAAGAYGFKNI